MTDSSVAITGMGAYSGFGPGVPILWESLLAGRSCASPETGVSTAADRVFEIALWAAKEALSTAQWPSLLQDTHFVLGTNVGRTARLAECSYEVPADLLVPEAAERWADHHQPAEDLRKELGIATSAVAITGACASGALALGYAFDLIAGGQAETVIAGAADEVTELKMSGHRSLQTASRSGKVRPFDAERDGTLFCEGAGFLVLESLEHCLRRGHKPPALLAGYGVGSDTNSLTAPDPDGTGAVFAMRAALKDARLPCEDIDHVQAHGTGTRLNDKIEAHAIREVFGAHVSQMTVSADKGSIGHTFGACGVLSAILTVLMIQNELVPAVTGLDKIDEACRVPLVVNRPSKKRVSSAVCNSLGFGGGNVALVIQRYRETK